MKRYTKQLGHSVVLIFLDLNLWNHPPLPPLLKSFPSALSLPSHIAHTTFYLKATPLKNQYRIYSIKRRGVY